MAGGSGVTRSGGTGAVAAVALAIRPLIDGSTQVFRGRHACRILEISPGSAYDLVTNRPNCAE